MIYSKIITVTHTLDPLLWSEFIYNHPHGNIFHTPEMFDVYKNSKFHYPKIWSALSPKNELLALFIPVIIESKQMVLKNFTRRSIIYGSILS